MWKAITDKFNNWFDSFNNQDSGWSRKKLTSYALLWTCYISANTIYLYYAFKNKDFSLMPSIQTINGGVILALLGIAAWQGIQNKKIDNDNTPPTPQP